MMRPVLKHGLVVATGLFGFLISPFVLGRFAESGILSGSVWIASAVVSLLVLALAGAFWLVSIRRGQDLTTALKSYLVWIVLPVIVMSGEGLLQDAVSALKLGAWDYLSKPIASMAALQHSVGMALEGVCTWILLELWGVPMAALLGLLTGLLAFLPNIGAPISGCLMILVGFSGGVDMGIYCIVVYVVVQTVDGYLIVPMVAKKTVDLAPALVLGAQLIMGILFGIIGLALADPMVAMIKIWLEREAARHEVKDPA